MDPRCAFYQSASPFSPSLLTIGNDRAIVQGFHIPLHLVYRNVRTIVEKIAERDITNKLSSKYSNSHITHVDFTVATMNITNAVPTYLPCWIAILTPLFGTSRHYLVSGVDGRVSGDAAVPWSGK